jgi:hypothetical protein
MNFNYLIDKINAASIDHAPFAHLQINDFFTPEHFSQLIAAPEIALHAVTSDTQLFEMLFAAGYKVISFPGCITDYKAYIDWHRDKSAGHRHNNTACEGFGVTLRLMTPTSPIIDELNQFLASEPFKQAIAAKFAINLDAVYYDGGIQKYLDGYEISPHPDIRRKALTYMVNVNPSAQSAAQDHHTHYLKFRDAYAYVQAYWEGHPHEDRCWVPWDWCESVKQQRENNSIVIFSPNNATVHGVKARYDHFAYQRTQLYGNLWYRDAASLPLPEWEDFVIQPRAKQANSLANSIRAAIPKPVKNFIRKAILGDAPSVIGQRNRD